MSHTKVRFLVLERVDKPEEATVETQFGDTLVTMFGPAAVPRAQAIAGRLQAKFGGLPYGKWKRKRTLGIVREEEAR